MAIITCPECKNSISDKTNQCIHCGYMIKLCPECQTLLEEHAEVCPECGYSIHKNSKNADSQESGNAYLSKKGIHTLYKQWESESGLIKAETIKSALNFVAKTLLLIIIWWKFKSWVSSISSDITSFEFLNILNDVTEAYNKTIETIIILSVAYVIIVAINSILDFFIGRAKEKDFKQWYFSKNLDMNQAVAFSLNNGLSKMSEQHRNARKTEIETPLEYLSLDKSENFSAIKIIFNVFAIIAKIVTVSIFMYAIIENMKVYMENYTLYLLKMQNEAPQIISNWVPLIVLGGVLLIRFAVFWISTDFGDKCRDTYVKENVPECYSLYRRYIMDDNSYFPDEEQ